LLRYAHRAQATFGQSVRRGVLSAMIRQDYEYFDKTPSGVLQVRRPDVLERHGM